MDALVRELTQSTTLDIEGGHFRNKDYSRHGGWTLVSTTLDIEGGRPSSKNSTQRGSSPKLTIFTPDAKTNKQVVRNIVNKFIYHKELQAPYESG